MKSILPADYEEPSLSAQNFHGSISSCVVSPHVDRTGCRNIELANGFGDNQTIVTDFTNGRLGNQLSAYATLLGAKYTLGLKPMLLYDNFVQLSKYFKTVDMPIIDKEVCNYCSDENFKRVLRLPMSDEDIDQLGHFKEIRKGRMFLVPTYQNIIYLYKNYLPEIRRAFNFQPEYQEFGRSTLERLKEDWLSKNGVEPIFVGIHNRRSDFHFLMKNYNGKLVDNKYFDKAMDFFRRKFSNAIFVVATDDYDWARKNIVGDDVFYSPSKDLLDNHLGAAADLALLSQCNHSIITYGSFGMWSALLAGGTTIMADNYSKEEPRELREMKKANLENWIFLDPY